jgi:hypothetical protein
MENLKKTHFLWAVSVKKLILVSTIVVAIFLGLQTPAQAGVSLGIGIGGRGHHGSFSIGGFFPLGDYYYPERYYYGPYYPPTSYSYVVEPAPVGVVVYAIPANCRQMVVNGVMYFEYYGTYYMPVAGGYQVVPPPVLVQPAAAVAAPSVITPNTASTNPQEDITVNVPNSQGGYTAVILKRSGSGFVGPQGEYYAEFPKVAQLQAMYGK